MTTVFIDTSVLFSACYSKSGASALILGLCRRGKVRGYVSKYILSEAKRNAAQKLNQVGKLRLNFFVLQSNLVIIDNPTFEEITSCEKIVNSKDAPILASAIKSKAKFLVTLDRKHFFQPTVSKLAKAFRIRIVTPGDFVFKELKTKVFP